MEQGHWNRCLKAVTGVLFIHEGGSPETGGDIVI